MNNQVDRLFELLPVLYQQRDALKEYPLRALLQVIAEQVNVVEADMNQLYENWFIETSQDWVVPYIGDLVGYRIAHEAGQPGDLSQPQEQLRHKILIPRRDVANTIRYRRRKGTLALLELLAQDVAGWPARAVEFYKLLGVAQAINHLRLDRGYTVDLRQGNALDCLNGPFDELAHTVDVCRINSHRTTGWHNIPSLGLFVWRLRAYSVTRTPAYCLEQIGPHCYTFSVLGNDTPLYTHPQPETEPTNIAGELNLPTPIRRRALETNLTDYYGTEKSLQIWLGQKGGRRKLVPAEDIIVADLSGWQYRTPRGKVAVDPVLGRIAFPPRQLPKQGVWVSYYYGFSADVGGGEYKRTPTQPVEASIYKVGEGETYMRINDALAQWQMDEPAVGVIEITDSGVYVEQINIDLGKDQRLQIQAANHTRPVIRLLNWQTELPDYINVRGRRGSHFTLDGLLITGRGLHITGKVNDVIVRHCTLVPGWRIGPDCEPQRATEPSLELVNTPARIVVSHSIIGSIQVTEDEVKTDPIPITINDSVLDATSMEREALGAPEWPMAHAILTIRRSTVFGYMQTHAIDLAENSIFMGHIKVGRRQRGCMRFCYVVPDSRTPRRYNCQPDLVERVVETDFPPGDERENARKCERLRVRPRFNSTRYGMPTYCQLALDCAEEITEGADDESEMGVFHHLYQPQRVANLRARLEEYTPAGMDAGIIYAS
jgi:hypothetical protein